MCQRLGSAVIQSAPPRAACSAPHGQKGTGCLCRDRCTYSFPKRRAVSYAAPWVVLSCAYRRDCLLEQCCAPRVALKTSSGSWPSQRKIKFWQAGGEPGFTTPTGWRAGCDSRTPTRAREAALPLGRQRARALPGQSRVCCPFSVYSPEAPHNYRFLFILHGCLRLTTFVVFKSISVSLHRPTALSNFAIQNNTDVAFSCPQRCTAESTAAAPSHCLWQAELAPGMFTDQRQTAQAAHDKGKSHLCLSQVRPRWRAHSCQGGCRRTREGENRLNPLARAGEHGSLCLPNLHSRVAGTRALCTDGRGLRGGRVAERQWGNQSRVWTTRFDSSKLWSWTPYTTMLIWHQPLCYRAIQTTLFTAPN